MLFSVVHVLKIERNVVQRDVGQAQYDLLHYADRFERLEYQTEYRTENMVFLGAFWLLPRTGHFTGIQNLPPYSDEDC